MKDLEQVLHKVQHIIDDALKQKIGFTIDPFAQDLSQKIASIPLLDIDVDTSMPYKKAKQRFLRQFITRLLQQHEGNISQAAKTADVERRTLHRLINKLNIDVDTIRRIKHPYSEKHIKKAVNETIAGYEHTLHPERITALYRYSPTLSKEIGAAMRHIKMSLEEALKLFDRTYIHEIIKQHDTITAAAKAAGLRPETVHRKRKS